MYEPTTTPSDAPPGLRSWLAAQLRQIADALGRPEVASIRFGPLAAQPEHYVEGDLVFANGTDWNPGSGAGLYERRGGAWRKL
jgi:hypothetical protein